MRHAFFYRPLLGALFLASTLAAHAQRAPQPDAPEGMTWIPAGSFRMGGEGLRDAMPIHSGQYAFN